VSFSADQAPQPSTQTVLVQAAKHSGSPVVVKHHTTFATHGSQGRSQRPSQIRHGLEVEQSFTTVTRLDEKGSPLVGNPKEKYSPLMAATQFPALPGSAPHHPHFKEESSDDDSKTALEFSTTRHLLRNEGPLKKHLRRTSVFPPVVPPSSKQSS
jgi:hypothetical protein